MKMVLPTSLLLTVAASSAPAQYATNPVALVPGADYTIVQHGPDSRIWAHVDLLTNPAQRNPSKNAL
jgi:hypothetical protein